MPADVVLTEARGRVLVITINRPEARNAVNRSVAEGVGAALDHLDADSALRRRRHRGRRDVQRRNGSEGFRPRRAPRHQRPGLRGITQRSARKPLLAAIEGYALAGGLEIGLACDIVIAARDAKLGVPEVRLGLMAGTGGLLRLPRRIGPRPCRDPRVDRHAHQRRPGTSHRARRPRDRARPGSRRGTLPRRNHGGQCPTGLGRLEGSPPRRLHQIRTRVLGMAEAAVQGGPVLQRRYGRGSRLR